MAGGRRAVHECTGCAHAHHDEDQLEAAIDAGDAFTIVTATIFHCNLVSRSAYGRATPTAPVFQ